MEIILASSSPRRKEILENINIKFDVIKSDVEEIIFENEKPTALVMRLAFEKSIDIANENEEAIVIGADTIVVLDDKILGKPINEVDAFNMLKKLSNNSHQVITGISIINIKSQKKIVDYVISNVKFKELSDETINNYINTKEPLDKAGSYGIQGFGSLLVDKIDGDYFNIVGLPISKLGEILDKEFNYKVF